MGIAYQGCGWKDKERPISHDQRPCVQDGHAAKQRKKWEISCGEMRELIIKNLLKLAIEVIGVKRKWRFDVRRRGNLHVWHLPWR